jgi:pSer/pThr/pTyr-binding forkhead associated (FHA) protein
LEGACDKEKSVIMIQNIPNEGIKLGRGHECEIRITDISVSRNHGLIKNQPDGFYIFDNKSKFGTLVRDEKMEIEISRMGQGVQVGRTVVSFELRKDEVKEPPKISKSVKGITDHKF